MLEIYLSCSLATATFLELNFDFAYFNLLFVPVQALPRNRRTVRMNQLIAYFIIFLMSPT